MHIDVDYKELVVDEAVTQAVSSLRHDLRDMPEHMIKCLGLAQHQAGIRQGMVSGLPITHQMMISERPTVLCKTDYHLSVICHLNNQIPLNCIEMMCFSICYI